MKRALTLLLTLPLVAAAFAVAPAAAQTCNCTTLEEDCRATCEDELCRKVNFICTPDPCNYTCTCTECAP